MIGKRLIELRNKKKLTQKAVADKIKISRSAYSNYESDFREPDFKNVELLADVFEVSVDYLLGRESKEHSIEETEEDHLRSIAFDMLKGIKDINELQKAVDHLEYLESKIKK